MKQPLTQMFRLSFVLVLVLLGSACASNSPVRCEGALTPINPPHAKPAAEASK